MLNVIWLILNSSIQYGDILSNGIKLQPFLLKKKIPMLIAAEEATGLVNYSHILEAATIMLKGSAICSRDWDHFWSNLTSGDI